MNIFLRFGAEYNKYPHAILNQSKNVSKQNLNRLELTKQSKYSGVTFSEKLYRQFVLIDAYSPFLS